MSSLTARYQRSAIPFRAWLETDGPVWLHLAKTLIAAFCAMGIAMRLELPQPRVAVTTTFVLMQPLSGMVIAKSVYRVLGTVLGMAAALTLGAVCIQQAELYLIGLTGWIAACTALAMRYRRSQWYGIVLAGYTAALIGVPVATNPDALFLATLARGSEVMVGIVCSTFASALIFPRHAGATLWQTFHARQATFNAFAADVLRGRLDRHAKERGAASFVDSVVKFESTRSFSSYEPASTRADNARLASANGWFMSATARLFALDQTFRRSGAPDAQLATLLDEVAGILAHNDMAALQRFAAQLGRRLPADGLPPESAMCRDLLRRFVSDEIRAGRSMTKSAFGLVRMRYVARTHSSTMLWALLRTVVAIGAMAWFWVATAWPSGGYGVIGAALACALSSSAPRPAQFAARLAGGAVLAVICGYAFVRYVYPSIDGFVMLCVVLAPPLAAGAFLAMRPTTAGLGIGFCVYFCLLAAPDNPVTYDLAALLNNGVALAASTFVTAVACAVIVPPASGALVNGLLSALRGQVALACEGRLSRIAGQFHSGTHDVMSQILGVQDPPARTHRREIEWMLVTLEVGQAVIDLRRATRAAEVSLVWQSTLTRLLQDIAALFRSPRALELQRAIESVETAIATVDRSFPHEPRKTARVLMVLHLLRSILADPDSPFVART